MEDLTHQQMVLLTILVSFVTSIAMSITIVSLLTGTTPTVSQTINRIVEKTIETVVPSAATSTPIVITKQAPTPVSEEDQITNAVQVNSLAIVRIFVPKTDTADAVFLGDGFSVTDGGYIVTDKNILGEGADFLVMFGNKKTYAAKKAYGDTVNGFALLQITPEKEQPSSVRNVSLASGDPKLGQTVLSLGGAEASTLGKGIVSELIKVSDTDNHIVKIISTISFKKNDAGGPLFGLDGKVIGVNITGADGEKYTVPSALIMSAIQSLQKPKDAKVAENSPVPQN